MRLIITILFAIGLLAGCSAHQGMKRSYVMACKIEKEKKVNPCNGSEVAQPEHLEDSRSPAPSLEGL